MLVVEFKNKWYRYGLFTSLLLVVIMSALQLINEMRIFSIVHILLGISIGAVSNYSYKYFRLLIKLCAVLLIFSGGMILLSTVFYLLSGALNKILVDGNILGAIYLVIGIVLYRYFERSVMPLK